MKTAILLSLLLLTVHSLKADDVQTSRTLLRIGFLMTKGDDTGWDAMTPGLTLNTMTFFDPAVADGWYYGILGSALTRSAGGVVLADTRLVTLGWRGNLFALWGAPGLPVQCDAGVAPTIGSRISNSTILGSLYTGLGVTLGLGISITDGQDLGLSWEPVFPLMSWGRGDPQAPNRGYSDFVVSWTVKSLFETRKLKW